MTDLVGQVLHAAGGSLLNGPAGDPRRAARLVAEARRTGSASGRPDRELTVAGGLAALFCGHAGRAEQLLRPIAESGDAAGPPDRTWAQASLYLRLARWHRWFLLPGGGGNLLMTECAVRRDLQADAVAAEAERPALLAAGGGDLRWELEVTQVLDLVWILTNVDGSELATGRMVAPDRAATILGELARRLEAMSELAARAGSATDQRLAQLYLADVAKAAGDDSAIARLQAVYDEADAAGDDAMAGWCLLRGAEWRVAPLGGAPVFDLAVQEPGDAGIDLAPPYEVLELQATEVDADAIQGWVDEAATRFERAACPRGLAQAELHRSFLAFVRNRPDDQRTAAAAARGHAQASGDRRLALLAWAHTLVAESTDPAGGGSPLDRATARRIGRWGAEEGSFAFALGIGLLLNRLANHWLTRRDEPRGAETLLRVAGELLTALGADTNRLQSQVGSGDAAGAVGITLEQTGRYRRALEGYLDLVERGRSVRGDDARRARLLAGTLHGTALTTRDPEQLTEAGAQITRTLDATGGPPPTTDLVELLQAEDHAGFEHAVTGLGLVQAAAQVPVSAAVLEGERARRAGDDEAAQAAFDRALAAVETLDEGVRPFWRAFALLAADRSAEAVAAYDDYLAGGGHDRAIFDMLTASLATMGPAGQESAGSTAHANDRDAARLFATLGRFDRARRHLDAAAQASGEDWWRREAPAWEARALIAEVDAGLGRDEVARAGYAEAIALLEREDARGTTDEERTALGGRRSAVLVHAGAAMAAARTEDHGPAIDLMERGKARALVDLVRSTHEVRGRSDEQVAALRRWRQLTTRAAALRRLLAGSSLPAPATQQLGAELDGLTTEIDAVSPGLIRAGLIGSARAGASTDADAIAAALPAGTVLVTWLATRGQLLTGVIAGGGGIDTRLMPIAPDEVTAALNRFTAASRSGTHDGGSGARLAELLLDPWRSRLADAEHVVFVPWGAGNQTPLHALPFDGEPLVAHRAVSYLPSAGLAPLLQRTSSGVERGPMLVVGDPDGMRWRAPGEQDDRPFAALPFARAEARLVGTEAEVLIGPDATEAAVRAALPGRRVVHLATHGCLVDGAPQLSAVLLADGDHLTVDELIGLDLDVDLVVLSACDTGRGEVTEGNEVVGLARALVGVGARAAVVSLWKAPDLATCLLMRRFYDRRRSGVAGPKALADAQWDLACTSFDDQLDEYLALPDEIRGEGPSTEQTQAIATRGRGTAAPAEPEATGTNAWAPFVYLGLD